jgi:glucose-6-phosphate 1-dehydrogenase
MKQMAAFPGPLTSSSSLDKVGKYIKEYIKNDADSNEDSQLLWELVKEVCHHSGDISSTENFPKLQAAVRELLSLTPAEQMVIFLRKTPKMS